MIPAAGSSRRMGRSKALLELDGHTFLRRCIDALVGGGCPSVLAVVAEGDDAVAAEARAAGARVLVNPDPGEGPITSLRLALSALRGVVDGIVYLPVDHPVVSVATVERLLAAAREPGSDAPLLVPTHGGERGHPAVFRSTIFDELTDPTLEGGARTVVHRHLASATLVPVDDEGVLADVDTPALYQALLAAEGRL